MNVHPAWRQKTRVLLLALLLASWVVLDKLLYLPLTNLGVK